MAVFDVGVLAIDCLRSVLYKCPFLVLLIVFIVGIAAGLAVSKTKIAKRVMNAIQSRAIKTKGIIRIAARVLSALLLLGLLLELPLIIVYLVDGGVINQPQYQYGDYLSYYGTVIAVLSAVAIYVLQAKSSRSDRKNAIRPNVSLVIREVKGCYEFELANRGNCAAFDIAIERFTVISALLPGQTQKKCIRFHDDENQYMPPICDAPLEASSLYVIRCNQLPDLAKGLPKQVHMAMKDCDGNELEFAYDRISFDSNCYGPLI